MEVIVSRRKGNNILNIPLLFLWNYAINSSFLLAKVFPKNFIKMSCSLRNLLSNLHDYRLERFLYPYVNACFY
jgi:hypothetical protein